jgi:hypothetical protein
MNHDYVLASLRTYGVCRLPEFERVDEFSSYLEARPKYPGHVKARPRPGVSCNSMSDVLSAPYFLDYAKSLQPLVEAYFEVPAFLWSLNAYYMDGDTPYMPGVNGLHVDKEADKILTLFTFGTDVDITGAQVFVDSNSTAQLIYGRRGTTWLADNRKMHCGMISKQKRMIAWARWADKIPRAFYDEQLPVIP